MELLSSRDIINKLKEVKQDKGLSAADIERIIKENGGHLSLTTIKRVFAKHSDCLSFSHDYTLLPIAEALGIDIAPDVLSAEMIKEMNTIINAQEDDIERLREKNKSLEKDIAFLRQQIANKDDLIRKLMEKVL